ncbi:MAG TPA: hypothetical protein VH475_27535 [Tepidisphaeraceae bacterium]|jgi:hypothetical protein
MPADPPDPILVSKAIDVYLKLAYEGDPPAVVRSALSTLHAWGGRFYACPVFVKDAATPPDKYSMRLGNRYYPHMKMVIQRATDGKSFLFRADTHDRHICPPQGAPEHEEFVELMMKNQEIAQNVESAWAAAGIPTFKTWLREDLARRNA